MQGDFFFDTNIFIYLGLIPKSDSDRQKKEISRSLLSQPDTNIFISNQVLNEISNVLLKKGSLSKDQIFDFLANIIEAINIFPLSSEITFDAIDICCQYKLSFYDSLIVASALKAECSQLVTEDLQDQQIISYKSRQIKVINPFRDTYP